MSGGVKATRMYMRGAVAFAYIAGFGLAVGGREPPSVPLADQIFFQWK